MPVGVGRGVLVALGCGVGVGKGVSIATSCTVGTVDKGVSVAGGSSVGYGVSVAVGWGLDVDVPVGVGCAAISRASAVAVARTLSTRDMAGVAWGSNVSSPYPPSKQEAGTKQTSMKPTRIVKTVRSPRSCIDIARFLYRTEATIPHIAYENKE